MAQVLATVKQKTKNFSAAKEQTLLAACLDNRVRIDHICRNGLCGMCQVLIEDGLDHLSPPTMMEKLLLDTEALKSGIRLACQAHILAGPIKFVQPNLKSR